MITTPFVSVDGIVEITHNGKFQGIVLIERRNPPHGTALPGGFVDVGESVETALKREMREEIGLKITISRLLGVYSDPARDPRFHTVSAVYVATADTLPVAGDDAKSARVVSLETLGTLQYAFDHQRIIKDYLASRAP